MDYSKPHWEEAARTVSGEAGPDIIYEIAGGNITKQCLKILGAQGEIVVYGALNIQRFDLGVPELIGLIFKNQSLTGFLCQRS